MPASTRWQRHLVTAPDEAAEKRERSCLLEKDGWGCRCRLSPVESRDPKRTEVWHDHSHRIRGRCLVPRPGNVVPIRGSGSKRVSVLFKVGSRPDLRGVAAPLLADLIGIRRLRVLFLLDNEPSTCTMV